VCAAATQPLGLLLAVGCVVLRKRCQASAVLAHFHMVHQQHTIVCHLFCITHITFQELPVGPPDDAKHTKGNWLLDRLMKKIELL